MKRDRVVFEKSRAFALRIIKLYNYMKSEHSEYVLKRMRAGDFVNNALSQLMHIMNLENPPMHIEAYDISNISGDNNVGAMVTFKNGKPFKKGYRNFKIKTVDGQNDYASMKEMLSRRFARIGDDNFGDIPDLLLVDGGAGHVDVASITWMFWIGFDVRSLESSEYMIGLCSFRNKVS